MNKVCIKVWCKGWDSVMPRRISNEFFVSHLPLIFITKVNGIGRESAWLKMHDYYMYVYVLYNNITNIVCVLIWNGSDCSPSSVYLCKLRHYNTVKIGWVLLLHGYCFPYSLFSILALFIRINRLWTLNTT